MTADDRVNAVVELGFSERQARFLVTVMLFGGVCVPRQYAWFAGTAYGRKVNEFFAKLVERRYATVCSCIHNRARVYHIRHSRLYEAIGERRSRHRLPVPARQVIERLMRLDSVLCYPELCWLAAEPEKVEFFHLTVPSLAAERWPHSAVGTGAKRHIRLFPDDLPIGVDATGQPVFLYLVTCPFDDDFRAVLQRYGDLLGTLSRWTVRLLFPRQFAGAMGDFQAAFRDELATPFAPSTIDELRWYFEHLRLSTATRTRLPADDRFRRAHHAFASPRFRVLYRRWLSDGDAAFDVVSSHAIADALASEAGSLDCQVLVIPYRHLSPVADLHTADEGVEEGAEEGDEGSAHSQPLRPDADEDIATRCARDWQRLVDARNPQSMQ